MKPGPSSVRLFSKKPQSTMSRASSAKSKLPDAGCLRQWSSGFPNRGERVKFSLAPALVERVRAPAKLQAQGHGAKLQVAAHRVQQVPAVALRKLFEPIAEYDERGRTRLHLGNVAELDPLP